MAIAREREVILTKLRFLLAGFLKLSGRQFPLRREILRRTSYSSSSALITKTFL